MFSADKHAMTHELGIQIRDLRLLDPLLATSYPSAVLCRDKVGSSSAQSVSFPLVMKVLVNFRKCLSQGSGNQTFAAHRRWL